MCDLIIYLIALNCVVLPIKRISFVAAGLKLNLFFFCREHCWREKLDGQTEFTV